MPQPDSHGVNQQSKTSPGRAAGVLRRAAAGACAKSANPHLRKNPGVTWVEFCPHYACISRSKADDLIRRLDEFGGTYTSAPAWGPMYGSQAVSEQFLAEQVIGRLPEGSIIVYDRNFGVFSVNWYAQPGRTIRYWRG